MGRYCSSLLPSHDGRTFQNPSQQEVFTNEMGHPVHMFSVLPDVPDFFVSSEGTRSSWQSYGFLDDWPILIWGRCDVWETVPESWERRTLLSCYGTTISAKFCQQIMLVRYFFSRWATCLSVFSPTHNACVSLLSPELEEEVILQHRNWRPLSELSYVLNRKRGKYRKCVMFYSSVASWQQRNRDLTR